MVKQPDSVEAFFSEVRLAEGSDSRLDNAIARVGKELADFENIEYRARRIVELMALVLQGAQLVRHGHPAVADAFCASRLDSDWGIALALCPQESTPRAFCLESDYYRSRFRHLTGANIQGILEADVPETIAGGARHDQQHTVAGVGGKRSAGSYRVRSTR